MYEALHRTCMFYILLVCFICYLSHHRWHLRQDQSHANPNQGESKDFHNENNRRILEVREELAIAATRLFEMIDNGMKAT